MSESPVQSTASPEKAELSPPAASSPTATTDERSQSPTRQATSASPTRAAVGPLPGDCVWCHRPMGKLLGTMCDEGPLHNDCVVKYKATHVERCVHCERALGLQRSVLSGKKLHPGCVADYKGKVPFVPRSHSGILSKFSLGKSLLSSKNWKERYFSVSPQTLSLDYYESASAQKQGAAPLGSIPLSKPSSPTTAPRLITKPTRENHPEAVNPSRDFIVVFFEGSRERRLLCQASTWQEQAEWCDVLADYIREVDSPLDVIPIQ